MTYRERDQAQVWSAEMCHLSGCGPLIGVVREELFQQIHSPRRGALDQLVQFAGSRFRKGDVVRKQRHVLQVNN